MPWIPTMPWRRRYSSSVAVARQEDDTGDASRTTKPSAHGRPDSGSSSFTPVLPMCGYVMQTICPL